MNNSKNRKYQLDRDTIQVRAMLFYKNRPFGEIMLEQNMINKKYELEYFQGAKKTKWTYSDSINNREYFTCILFSKKGFAPLFYRFYCNDKGEIVGKHLFKNHEVKLEDIINEHRYKMIKNSRITRQWDTMLKNNGKK